MTVRITDTLVEFVAGFSATVLPDEVKRRTELLNL